MVTPQKKLSSSKSRILESSIVIESISSEVKLLWFKLHRHHSFFYLLGLVQIFKLSKSQFTHWKKMRIIVSTYRIVVKVK